VNYVINKQKCITKYIRQIISFISYSIHFAYEWKDENRVSKSEKEDSFNYRRK